MSYAMVLAADRDLPACCCETVKTVCHDPDLQADQQSLDALRAYLLDTLSPGESVELWGIWEGEYRSSQGASPSWRTAPAPIKILSAGL